MAVQRLRLEQAGDLTIVYFVDKNILEDRAVQVVAEQLFSLVEIQNKRKLLLDLGNLEYVSSAFLGKLIDLHKRLTLLKGQMAIRNAPRSWDDFGFGLIPVS